MYVVTRDCPIQCLAPLLSRMTLAALVVGLPAPPATVGQLIEMYEQGRLTDVYNISSGRVGEIRSCLIQAKLVDPDSRHGSKRDGATGATVNGHHVSCPQYARKSEGSEVLNAGG